MTKDEAIFDFFSGFDVAVYALAAVPDDAVMPYIAYTMSSGAWGDENVGIDAQLWYYTESELLPEGKASEIGAALGLGGTMLPCDGGAVWLRRGNPWQQSIFDESEKNARGRRLSLTAQFITSD